MNEGLSAPKAGARTQILAAATELAKETGAGHISIDAIARRAGVSKGGLLYHFPTKNDLIRALIEQHTGEVEALLGEAETSAEPGRRHAVARAYLEIYRDKVCDHAEAPDGVLMALAENPDLLEPVRAHERRLVDRMRDTAGDRELGLIAMLVVGGMKALDLFEANPLSADERNAIIDRMVRLLDESPDPVEPADGDCSP